MRPRHENLRVALPLAFMPDAAATIAGGISCIDRGAGQAIVLVHAGVFSEFQP